MRCCDAKAKLLKYKDLYFKKIALENSIMNLKSPHLNVLDVGGSNQPRTIVDKIMILEEISKEMIDIERLVDYLKGNDETFKYYVVLDYYFFQMLSIPTIATKMGYAESTIYKYIAKGIGEVAKRVPLKKR